MCGDTAKAMRQRIIEAARSQIGTHKWDEYIPGVCIHPGARVSWCGIFCLWTLKSVGLAQNIFWEFGKGFAYRLPITSEPKAGDIAYIDKPYQHHAIFESINPGGSITTIDGNQPGETVQRLVRPRKAFTVFYSIAPLLNETNGLPPDHADSQTAENGTKAD